MKEYLIIFIYAGQFNNNMQSGIQQQEGPGFGMGGIMPQPGFAPDLGMQAQGLGGFLPGSFEQMQTGGMQAQGLGGMLPMQAQGIGMPMNPLQAQGAMIPMGGMPMTPMQVQSPMLPVGGFGQMQGISPYAGVNPYAVPIPYARPPIIGPFGLLYDETEQA